MMPNGVTLELPTIIEAATITAVVGATLVGGAAEEEEITPPSQSTTWTLRRIPESHPRSSPPQERETRSHPEHQ